MNEKNQARIMTSTMDVHVDRIPNIAITQEQYRKLGGVPVREPEPSDVSTPIWDVLEPGLHERPDNHVKAFASGETNSPSQKPMG